MSEDDAKRRLRLVRPGEEPPAPVAPRPAAQPGLTFPYRAGLFASMFDLTGKVALIVGGGGGLSRAIACAMADFGAQIAVADLNLEAAEATAAACDRPDREAMAAMLDVTDPDMVEDVVGQIEAQTGHIDILLNGAGITIRRPRSISLRKTGWR